jgi:hypothetical protein
MGIYDYKCPYKLEGIDGKNCPLIVLSEEARRVGKDLTIQMSVGACRIAVMEKLKFVYEGDASALVNPVTCPNVSVRKNCE